MGRKGDVFGEELLAWGTCWALKVDHEREGQQWAQVTLGLVQS